MYPSKAPSFPFGGVLLFKDMEIVYKKTKDLIPYANNPRKNDDSVDYVADSISEFGFKVPIVITKDNVIVTGHTRLKAAKKLHLKEVPCIIADDLTEDQIKAFRLVDNKVSEFSDWDFDKLNIEIEGIELDLEPFGFEFEIENEAEDEDGYYGDERERTFEQINLKDVDLNRVAGKYDMPVLKAETHIPEDLISFNYVLNTDAFEKGVHFYIDDYQFERLWHNPHGYMERLAMFDCCLTPDYSLYTEMPVAMQIWNIFRSRLIGQIMQDYGIKVIPTLSWCRKESYDFCFDGIEPGGVVSVSTIGVKKEAGATKLWWDGMDEAMARLKPRCVIVYGGDIGYQFNCNVKYIDNHNADRLKAGAERSI